MRIVALTLQDPWGPSHGGGQRTLALLDSLAGLGHDVTCVHPGDARAGAPTGVTDVAVPAPSLGQRTWPAALRTAKRHLVPMPTGAGARNRSLSAALRRLRPVDVLIVGEFPAASYRQDLPDARFWLDLPDLYSEFARQEVEVRTGLARRTARWQQSLLAVRERRLCARADVVTVAGWSDAERLRHLSGRVVTWLPNTFERPPVVTPPDPHPGPPVAGFLANFAFLPNQDAARLLADRWTPRLLDAGWRVLVAGHGSTALSLPREIEVMGPVPTPDVFYRRVTATLAPYRLGRGLKTKILESLAHRRPVLASSPALDGFPPDFRRLVTVVDLLAPSFDPHPPALPQDLAPALETFSRRAFVEAVAGLVGAEAPAGA